MFTGDPGMGDLKNIDLDTGTGANEDAYVYTQGNVDGYRAGILYFGVDGIGKIGVNSEGIRHAIQNKGIHDRSFIDAHHFKKLDRKPETYYYLGSGTGSSLW